MAFKAQPAYFLNVSQYLPNFSLAFLIEIFLIENCIRKKPASFSYQDKVQIIRVLRRLRVDRAEFRTTENREKIEHNSQEKSQ